MDKGHHCATERSNTCHTFQEKVSIEKWRVIQTDFSFPIIDEVVRNDEF
jgi:hypothetical protein